MASIDGLGSGLDTSTIIAQLMELEKQPQNRLNTQKLVAVGRATAWTQIGLAVSGLKTAADKLVTGADISGAVKATSANPDVVDVSAKTGAQTGTYAVGVSQLATAERRATTGVAAATVLNAGSYILHSGLAALKVGWQSDAAAAGTASAGYTLQVTAKADGSGYDLNTVAQSGAVATATVTGAGPVKVGDLNLTIDTYPPIAGTAQIAVARTKAGASHVELAQEINKAGVVASASFVANGADSAFVLTAKETGPAYDYVINDAQLTDAVVPVKPGPNDAGAGKPLILSVDGVGPITRNSNTVSDVINGVTFTVNKQQAAGDPPVSVTVAQDLDAAVGNAKAMIAAVNAIFTQVKSATAYDVTNRKPAPLTGNAGARQVATELQSAIIDVTPVGSGKTLNSIGVTVQKDGSYALDEAALKSRLVSDPVGAGALLSELSAKLANYATAMNRGETVTNGVTTTGLVETGKASAKSEQTRLQARIDDWDTRLTLTRARYTRQYQQLESAMGSLKSQGSWLSGAIAGLGSWTS